MAMTLPEKKVRRIVSNGVLLADIRRAARLIGHLPSFAEYRKEGRYSTEAIRNRFGSWLKAVEATGLEYHNRRSPSDRQIARDLSRVRSEIGRLPTYKEYGALGAFAPSTVTLRAGGGWVRALAHFLDVPIETARGLNGYRSIESRLGQLRRLARQIGHSPSQQEAVADAPANASKLVRHFGNWTNVLEAAGLPRATPLVKDRPVEEILADVVRVARSLGHVPSCSEYRKHGRFSLETATSRLSAKASWTAVKELVRRHTGFHETAHGSLLNFKDETIDMLKGESVDAIREFFGRRAKMG